MGQVVNVETAGCHVGCHEDGYYAVAEFFHHNVALLLRKVAMKGVGVISVVDEVIGHFLGFAFCAAEHYGVDAGVVVGDALEGEIFVAGVDHIIDMSHVGSAFVACADHELNRIVHIGLGYFAYFGRHGGREHEHFPVVGHMSENFVDRVEETHV